MTYTLELYFRRIMNKNIAKDFFILYFKFTYGEDYC